MSKTRQTSAVHNQAQKGKDRQAHSTQREEKRTSRASTPAQTQRPEVVLFAVTGMSPAVLTETVWALVHPSKDRQPIIPDRVVVVTTAQGKLRIEEELFKPLPEYDGHTVWQALRRAVLGANYQSDPRLNMEEIRVIARQDPKQGRSYLLEDIRTPADNEVAADFILEELRKLTENPDTQIIASLAGGRKTMSALLYAAMSLLGRDHDRLTHVLVSEPFDDPSLKPRFYFPTSKREPDRTHEHPRTGAVYSSADATLWLADVPFVRLRHLFPKQLGRYPGKFSALVRAYHQRIEEISGPPEVSLDQENLIVRVSGTPVRFTPREFALYAFLVEHCQAGKPAFDKQESAIEEFVAWVEKVLDRLAPATRPREMLQLWKASWYDPDTHELQPETICQDIRKNLSSIRKKFTVAGLAHLLHFLLPQPRAFGIRVRVVG